MPEIFPFTQLPTPNAGAPDRSAEPLTAAKAALRRAALARRDGLDPAERIAAARTIAADVGALPFSPGCAIGGYLAIRSEIDPAPLLEALRAAGHALALPVIRADGETMDFRVWDRAVGLVRASFGLSVPPETAAIVEPRHLLVPLAAFDRRGFRLGYGKGHYDRALARLDASGPVVAVGVAFACQEVDRVPEEAHDRPLDCILTEREFIVAKGSA